MKFIPYQPREVHLSFSIVQFGAHFTPLSPCWPTGMYSAQGGLLQAGGHTPQTAARVHAVGSAKYCEQGYCG